MAITFSFGNSSGKKRYRFSDHWPQTIGIGAFFILVDGWSELGSLADPRLIGISLVALVAFFIAFFKKLSAYRSVANVATSKIASAAQGFAEFNCRVSADNPTVSGPRFEQSCVWFHYIERERRGSGKNARWVVVNEEFSGKPIWLEDGSGARLLVHPGYLIQNDLPVLSETDHNGVFGRSRQHLLHYLQAGDGVMVNGQFSTFSQVDHSMVKHLLGPKAKEADHLPMLETIKPIAEQASNVSVSKAALHRFNVLGYCDHHRMGMIHFGNEAEYLGDKKWGLALAGAGLIAGVIASAVSLYQWLNLP